MAHSTFSRPSTRPLRRDAGLINPRVHAAWPDLLWLAALSSSATWRSVASPHSIESKSLASLKENPRPRRRPVQVHGEAQEPQGRARRADRPVSSRNLFRGRRSVAPPTSLLGPGDTPGQSPLGPQLRKPAWPLRGPKCWAQLYKTSSKPSRRFGKSEKDKAT